MIYTAQALRLMLQNVDVKALALEAGISSKTIYRIRTGQSCTLSTVDKIIAALRRMGHL